MADSDKIVTLKTVADSDTEDCVADSDTEDCVADSDTVDSVDHTCFF